MNSDTLSIRDAIRSDLERMQAEYDQYTARAGARQA